MEQAVVENTRSDIAVDRQPEKPPLLMEVVVTHEIEPATRQRYEASDLPVLVIYPEWSTVTELAHAAVAADAINVSRLCAACREADERRQRELSEADDRAQSMLRALGPTGSSTPSIRFWSRDRFGRQMYPHVRRSVQHNAVILRRIGFVQSETKPWLFLFRLPDRAGVVYANFGSTEDVAIWEDTAAFIHWQINGRTTTEKAALVRRLLQECRRMGADVRVSFYNQSFDQPPANSGK